MNETGYDLDVTVGDGKYRVVMPRGGGLRALRYGEEWRDLCGDGLILALAQRVRELEGKIDDMELVAHHRRQMRTEHNKGE